MKNSKVSKVFEGGLLVSLKKTKGVKPIKYGKVLQLLSAGRATQKNSLWSFEEFEREVCLLRRALISSQRLVKARTKERDAVSKAHKKQLERVKKLKYKLEDLEFQVEALEEEKEELDNTVSALGRDLVQHCGGQRPRAAAAKPIKGS